MPVSLKPSSFQPGYNGDKFNELLLYVASECADDPRFGATKLNKILFFSDFYTYAELGKAITGSRYKKLPFGPGAVSVLPAQKQLEERGDAAMVPTFFHGKEQKRFIARRKADLSLFTADEIAIVDRVIRDLWQYTAAGASDESHQKSVGWRTAEVDEDIPYQTVFLSNDAPTLTDLARGRELAVEHGW